MDSAASPDKDLADQIASQLQRLLNDRENEDLRSQLDGHLTEHPLEFAHAINQIYQPPHSTTLPDSDTAKKIPAGEWANCIDNQHCIPREIRSASSLADLISIVNEARGKGWMVRVVGAGHSFSNVAITYNKGSKQEGILVKPDGLKGVTLSDGSLLRAGVDPSHLVVVESGTTIHELNERLDNMQLGLINMGAYDHQTIAGAISTGTHGTGVSLGPIGSSVRSIVLVSETGAVYQIEPSNGITDPAKFQSQHPDRILMQDDDWFQSNVLAMGTFMSCVAQ
jgi:L-gulono-1,4-lactone dehydrogenase